MFKIEKNSKFVAVALLFVFMLAGCGGAEERKAKYLERGKAYFEEENYGKARVEFKNVLQIDPKSAEPYYYMGLMEERKKEWRKAFGFYNKAVDLNPEFVDARIHLGQFYVLAGDMESADEQVNEVLRQDSGNIEALVLRASILKRQNKEDESIVILEQVLDAEPGHSSASSLLASIYDNQDKPDEAILILEKAVSLNPDKIALNVLLIQAYLKHKDNDKAEKTIIGLVERSPESFEYRSALAEFYLNTGQPEKTESVLRDAVAANAEEVRRYELLASFIVKQYGNDKAITELENAIAAKPGLTGLQLALARLYVQSGQNDKAEAIHRQIVENKGTEPEGLKARNKLAFFKLAEGKTDEAKLLIDEVLNENPGDIQALMLRGQYYLQVKQFSDAVADFRVVLKDKPDSAAAMSFLAIAYHGTGDSDLAIEALLGAIDVEPQNPSIRLQLATILLSQNLLDDALKHINVVLSVNPASVAALRTKAEILARQGLVTELEQTLTSLEQVSPESGFGSLGKGRLYRKQEKYPEALAEFEKVLELQPDSLVALTEMVNTEIVMGDADAAVKRLEVVLEKDPDNNAVHLMLGMVYASMNEYVKAEEQFKEQIEVNPKNNVPYMQLSASRVRQGNMKAAEQALQDGLEALPYNPRLVNSLAALYARQGKLESAADVLQGGLSYAPGNTDFVQGYASILQAQNRMEEAIFVYERFLEKNPDHLLAINNLAALLADHRTDKESLQKAKDLAIRLSEIKQPAIMDTMGWVAYRLGEYDYAVVVLAEVVEKMPEVPLFNYHLGMAYFKSGDKAAAREYLSKAVGDEYTYNGVEEARRVYAEIGGE